MCIFVSNYGLQDHFNTAKKQFSTKPFRQHSLSGFLFRRIRRKAITKTWFRLPKQSFRSAL